VLVNQDNLKVKEGSVAKLHLMQILLAAAILNLLAAVAAEHTFQANKAEPAAAAEQQLVVRSHNLHKQLKQIQAADLAAAETRAERPVEAADLEKLF
jgi:hypothetical protein